LPPAPLTSFVGREREVATLLDLLGETRLLSLTGTGGSGKTRLARALVAHAAERRGVEAVWVELAPLRAPEHLAGHVAAALGVRDEGAGSLDAALTAALGDRALLLVLDNCEHVVQEAAAFVARYLERCPALRVLTTSREPLAITGERAWLVPGLSLPSAGVSDPAGVGRSEAGRLFVDRARDVLASFALTDANADAVSTICHRLDGIPLAIELAAARVRVLTPQKIAERLDDVFRLLTGGGRTAVPRHRTLRETIQWSYDLLAPAEAALLEQLSAFAGGFTLEAVEAVCADAVADPGLVLDVLAALVDKSLVVMDASDREPRYRLLETVRQYAAERLGADPAAADAARRRHAAFYLALVEAAEPHVFIAANDPAWLARLDAELGNVLAAADWLEAEPTGADALLRLAAALDWYANARGRFDVATSLLRRALARGAEAPPRSVARARVALAHHLLWTGELAASEAEADDALAMARAVGEPRLLAEALAALGAAAAFQGELARARVLLREAGALVSARDALQIFVLGVRAHSELLAGEVDTAVATGESVLGLLREASRLDATAEMLPGFGRALLAQGDLRGAARLLADGVAQAHRSGRTWSMVHNLEAMVASDLAAGRPERAARVLGFADGLRDRYGMRLRPYADADDRTRAALLAALGPEVLRARLADGRAMGASEGVAHAVHLPADADANADGGTGGDADEGESRGASPAVPTGAAPALVVHALGAVGVWREGVPLPEGAWRYAKPRELLLYLLAHPEGRTREQIGLAFWPDASAAQVKNSFHVILHHVRKTLGRPDLIAFDGKRYRMAWELGIVFDAAEFERAATEAVRAARAGAGDTAVLERLRAALALYRGDFLAEQGAGDWHLTTRERLARLHADAGRALAERLERAELWTEAAAAYRALVVADPLDEHATRRLMRCLARAGARGDALRTYDRLAALLRTDLEAEPEPETRTLYDRLRAAQPV
jgi:predicted ATPase/DNA-binding SARP family transcriptional activator